MVRLQRNVSAHAVMPLIGKGSENIYGTKETLSSTSQLLQNDTIVES